MAGWHHDNAKWKPKLCAVCKTEFTPKSGVNKFCSSKCRGKWKYITQAFSTDRQYKNISGNWSRYLARLLSVNGNRRSLLTKEILFDILKKQNYKCALTGVPLTCILKKGTTTKTNASVDRIEAGGPYTKDNVQLVCRAVNCWRNNTSISEFIEWCRKIVIFADKQKDK